MVVSMAGTRTSMIDSTICITIGSLSSDHMTKSRGKTCFFGLKWGRRAISVLAIRRDDRNSDLPIELRRTVEDFSREIVSKDLNTLPRPLTTQFSNSVVDGSRLRVAYQGVRGTFKEAAAEKAYPNCEAVPCEKSETAFEAVERGIVDRAILPFENSLGGSIHENYDLLIQYSLHIIGEVKLAVSHCLMANHSVEIEDLTRVISHPQYDYNNITRFLMLAREPIIHGSGIKIKTSIVFSLKENNNLGALLNGLSGFFQQGIHLTKIQSRDLINFQFRSSDEKSEYFGYLYYVDFKASMGDQNAQNALLHLKDCTIFLRVLGSYPIDVADLD